MLSWWWELLPLWLVRLGARAGCERMRICGSEWLTARADVLVRYRQPLLIGDADGDVDALGLVLLPPIRVPVETSDKLIAAANRRGFAVQAHVRDLLMRE